MTSSGHQPLISNRPLEDKEEQQPTCTMKAKVEEQEEFRGRKALDSSDGPSTQQLADSFQAQGDKLSEVLADIFLFFHFVLLFISVLFLIIFKLTQPICLIQYSPFFRNLYIYCEFYYQHEIYFLFIRLKYKIKTVKKKKKEVNPNLN